MRDEGGGVLFLEELIDVLNVIERVVDEEAQLGDDAQLVAHPCTQFVTDGLFVLLDILHQLLTSLTGEDAQVSGTHTQVG